MIDLQNLDKFYLDDFVKDIFIGFLQKLFNENLGEFHYDDDASVTKLNICDQFNLDNGSIDFKPIIYVRRRPLGFMNTTIDQLMSSNLMTGSSTRSDLITGMLEIVCVSREGLEACRLGGLVFLLVHQFRNMFRRMGMHDVAVKSLGEEEPKDIRSTMRVVEVPVAIQYAFQYSWAVDYMASRSTSSKDVDGFVSPNDTMTEGSKLLSDVGTGISTDPITGGGLVGAPSSACNQGDGLETDTDCPTCAGSDNSHICVPLSEYKG